MFCPVLSHLQVSVAASKINGLQPSGLIVMQTDDLQNPLTPNFFFGVDGTGGAAPTDTKSSFMYQSGLYGYTTDTTMDTVTYSGKIH